MAVTHTLTAGIESAVLSVAVDDNPGTYVSGGYVNSTVEDYTATITGASYSSGNIAVTIGSHTFTTDSIVVISDVTPAEYNIQSNILSTTATTITLPSQVRVYTGISIWGSTQSGFTANTSTLLYSGPGFTYTKTDLAPSVPYYVKYALIDEIYDVSDITAGSQISCTPKAGANAVSATLSNEFHNIPTDSTGSGAVYTGATTTMSVYVGVTDDSVNWTYTTSVSNVSATGATRSPTVVALSADTGYIDINATRTGYAQITRRFKLAKSKGGTPGTLGPAISITSNRPATFSATDSTLNITQTQLVFTTDVVGVSSPSYLWTFYEDTETQNTSTGLVTNTSTCTITQTVFSSAPVSNRKSLLVKCAVTGTGISTVTDIITINRLELSTASAGATVGAPAGTTVAGIITSTATLGGTVVSTVVTNASNGGTAYTGTTDYRANNVPTSTGVSVTSATTTATGDGKVSATVLYTFTQGSVTADTLFVRYSKSAITTASPSIATTPVTGSVALVLDPSTVYYFAIQAAKAVQGGVALGAMSTVVTHTSAASNYTGIIGSTATLGGTVVSTVVTNASAGASKNRVFVGTSAPEAINSGDVWCDTTAGSEVWKVATATGSASWVERIISASKITTGTLDAARIATNSLSADKIATGSLTANQIITVGTPATTSGGIIIANAASGKDYVSQEISNVKYNILGYCENAIVTATFTGTTMSVSAVTSGKIRIGDIVSATSVTAGTTITAYITGSGSTGNYIISTNPGTLTSRAVTTSSYGFQSRDAAYSITWDSKEGVGIRGSATNDSFNLGSKDTNPWFDNSNAGTGNTAIGENALRSNEGTIVPTSARDYNVAIGQHTLQYASSAGSNIAIGYQALRGGSNTAPAAVSGTGNIAIGYNAQIYGATGSNNIGIGTSACRGSSTIGEFVGNYNVALGTESLYSISSGSNNIAIGYLTATALLSNSDNIIIGTKSARYIPDVYNSVLVGGNIVDTSSTMQIAYAVVIGYGAGNSTPDLNSSVLIGYGANSSTGGAVVGIGYGAVAGDTGISIGYGAGSSAGDSSICIGELSNSIGGMDNSIIIGNGAGCNSSGAGTNHILIGHLSGISLAASLDSVVIVGAHSGTGLASNDIMIADGAGNQRLFYDSSIDTMIIDSKIALGADEATDTHAIKGVTTILGNHATLPALKVTQTNATAGAISFLVEDSTSPDSTPFAIDGTGKVIIGHTAYEATAGATVVHHLQSHSQATNINNGFGIYNWYSGGNYRGLLDFYKSVSGTIGTLEAPVTGDSMGAISWRAAGDAATWVQGAHISALVDAGTVSATSMPTRLGFYVTPNGGANPVEAMRIDNAGKVLLGLTSTPSTYSSLYTTGTVASNYHSQYGFSIDHWLTNGQAACLYFNKSRTVTPNTGTGLSDNDDIGALLFSADDGTNFIRSSAIVAEADAATSTGNAPGRLSFLTSALGGTLTERMRIGSDGSIGIGTPNTTQYTLLVQRNLTGNINTYGIASQGVAQSDSTTSIKQFYSSISTAAGGGSYTIANAFGYFAGQGTLHADSTVTNQYGFYVQSTLTGATNNYGFYSNIGTAANRWNFYAGGDAPNYFAGATTLAGNTMFTSTVTHTGATLFSGVANLTIATMTGNTMFTSTVTHTGATLFSGVANLTIATMTGNTMFTSTVTHTGATLFSGVANLTIATMTGNTMFTSTVTHTGATLFSGVANLTIATMTGNTMFTSTVTHTGATLFSGTASFGIATHTGNTMFTSTVTHTGATLFSGVANFNNTISIGNGSLANAAYIVHVDGNHSNGAPKGIRIGLTFDNTAITTAYNTLSIPTYAPAAAGTCTNVVHYAAVGTTVSGTGTTVTTEIGFQQADQTNTAVGTCTAVKGLVNSLSGKERWNLEITGTAANYLAGPVLVKRSVTGRATTATATLTATELLSGLVTYAAGAVSSNWILPAGSSIESALNGSSTPVGASFTWSIINLASNAITMNATGYVGNANIAATTSASFITIRTGSNAYTTYRIT